MARQPLKQLGIIAKPREPRAASVASRISEWAGSQGLSLLVDDSIYEPYGSVKLAPAAEIADSSELLVVLGGDGTMIAAARLVGGRGTPVIGINLGSLGYLTEFAVEDAIPALDRALRGEFRVDRRMMLSWAVLRGGEQVEAGTVLNDAVVNHSNAAKIIEIECFVDRHYVTTYRADGLIVATPTGSTAYNLSAGGPIIHPTTEAISIAPICPHTLTNRPIVLPDTAAVTLHIPSAEEQTMIAVDGQPGLALEYGDQVELRKSENTFNMVLPKDRDYFQILRDKLKWSGR